MAFDQLELAAVAAPARPSPRAVPTLAQRLNAELRDAHPLAIIAAAVEVYGDRLALVSSFGAESAVLLHMVAEINPNTPILFLNTGKLFGETLRYRDRLQDELGLGDVRSLAPTKEARETLDPTREYREARAYGPPPGYYAAQPPAYYYARPHRPRWYWRHGYAPSAAPIPPPPPPG